MKKIAIMAAVIVMTAATAANASTGPRTNSLGGPIKQGAYCWITTNLTGAGYWYSCGEVRPSTACGSRAATPSTMAPSPAATVVAAAVAAAATSSR